MRLTDVLDLFRRAQMGQNSYAMMSQGLVDEVLAMRPQERRELIEEAADVRRHRQQVVLSERRLTETRDNMGHVRTLIRELEPRLRQLERQTKKAQRFEDLQARLREALCVYFEQELRTANDALVAARARHDQRTQDFSQARSAADRLDARLAELEAVAAERRRALEELQTTNAASPRRASRSSSRWRSPSNGWSCSAAVARTWRPSSVRPPRSPRTATATATAWRRWSCGRRRRARRSSVSARRFVPPTGRPAPRCANSPAPRRNALDWRRNSRTPSAAWRSTSVAAGSERSSARRPRRDARSCSISCAHSACARSNWSGAGRRWSRPPRRRDGGRDEAEARLEAQLRALIETRDGARLAEARASVQRERLEMLRELAAGLTADGDGGRALLAAAAEPGADEAPLEGIVGTIGELIRVPEGLEVAIEAALAGQLSAIVVQHEEDAIAAIAYLREQEAGTATLLPLDSVAHNYPLNLFNERGVIGVAARLARTEQQYRPLIDTLLGRTIVVDDLETARRMIRRGLGAVVTRDGVLLRPGGAYYGGQAGAGAQRFAIQGEIESLPAHIDEAQRHAETQRAGVEHAEAEVVAAREAVERAREGVDEAEVARRSHDGQLAGLRREQSSLSAEMRLVRQSLERDADGDAATAAAGRRDELARAQQSVEGEITTLRDGSEAVVVERDTVAERVTTAAANLALAEGAHRVESEQRQERSEARRRARARTTQLQSQVEQARREIEDLELSLRELREQAVNGRSTLALAQAANRPPRTPRLRKPRRSSESARRAAATSRRGCWAAERASLQADSELRECGSRLQALTQQLTEEGLAVVDGTVRLAAERSAGDAADEDASADGAAADGAAEDGAAADGAAEDGASAGRPCRGERHLRGRHLRRRRCGAVAVRARAGARWRGGGAGDAARPHQRAARRDARARSRERRSARRPGRGTRAARLPRRPGRRPRIGGGGAAGGDRRAAEAHPGALRGDLRAGEHGLRRILPALLRRRQRGDDAGRGGRAAGRGAGG